MSMMMTIALRFIPTLVEETEKIINAQNRFFVVMPSRKNASGEYKDIVHPINSDFRQKMEKTLENVYILDENGNEKKIEKKR